MAENPASLLRRAAERIREHAGYLELGSIRGPWSVHAGPTGYPQSVNNVGVPIHICDTFTDPKAPPTVAHWIALMHPGIAAPLARTLAEVADCAEEEGSLYEPTATDAAVIALARVILGSAAAGEATDA